MLAAIRNELLTGTIKKIFPKGSNIINIRSPYVVVWGPELIKQVGYENAGKDFYTISAHFQKGFINQLDDYIFNEVYSLLNKKRLTSLDGRKLTLFFSGGVSDIINNDDGTISKERSLFTVGFYGGE